VESKERGLYLKNNRSAAPSSEGVVGVFSCCQENSAKRIECNCPPSTTPKTPLTLLHPVFGEFLDTCNSGDATAEDHDFALNLSRAMSSFYRVLARLTRVARAKRRIKFVAFSGTAVNSRLRSPSISSHSVDVPPATSLIDFERASSTLERHAYKRRARAKRSNL